MGQLSSGILHTGHNFLRNCLDIHEDLASCGLSTFILACFAQYCPLRLGISWLLFKGSQTGTQRDPARARSPHQGYNIREKLLFPAINRWFDAMETPFGLHLAGRSGGVFVTGLLTVECLFLLVGLAEESMGPNGRHAAQQGGTATGPPSRTTTLTATTCHPNWAAVSQSRVVRRSARRWMVETGSALGRMGGGGWVSVAWLGLWGETLETSAESGCTEPCRVGLSQASEASAQDVCGAGMVLDLFERCTPRGGGAADPQSRGRTVGVGVGEVAHDMHFFG